MGTLYLVSTPIGNLKDITFRALEILRSVDLVLCEDTRKTGFLLAHYEIKKRLLSYFEHNEIRRIPEVIAKLKGGQDLALVSNAGTPTVSDPGFKLVRECLAEGIQVCPIPGASAILATLVASGLPTDKFTFLGFLPRKKGPLAKLFRQCLVLPDVTYCAFESPHRLLRSLGTLGEIVGENTQIAVGRELTKLHEEIIKGTPTEVIEQLGGKKIRGEVTLVWRISN